MRTAGSFRRKNFIIIGKLLKTFAKILLVLTIFAGVYCNSFSQPEPKGRMAYFHVKPFKQYYGEILSVRDSFLVISPVYYATNALLLRNIDSISILPLKKIQYINLQAVRPHQAWRTGVIGGVAGLGYGLINYLTSNKSNANTNRSLFSIPIGFALGYLIGIMVDAGNSMPDEVFIPTDSTGLTPLKISARFKNGEPAEFGRAIDSKILYMIGN